MTLTLKLNFSTPLYENNDTFLGLRLCFLIFLLTILCDITQIRINSLNTAEPRRSSDSSCPVELNRANDMQHNN